MNLYQLPPHAPSLPTPKKGSLRRQRTVAMFGCSTGVKMIKNDNNNHHTDVWVSNFPGEEKGQCEVSGTDIYDTISVTTGAGYIYHFQ